MVYEEPKDYREPRKLRAEKEKTSIEVAYEETKDNQRELSKLQDKNGREAMVKESPAYENPREVAIDLEDCRAYGKVSTSF